MTGRIDGEHRMRAAPRYKLFQPTAMTTPAGTARVHLLNLSTGGALVHADQAPPPGSLLRLQCGEEQRVARVAWANGRRFGAAFSLPLSESQVEAMVLGRTQAAG